MEPLTTAAIAVGTIIATKALEKTGENIGQTVWNKINKFLATLKKHSPHTVAAIEKTPEQPLDYGKAVLEVETVANADSEVNQTMQELAVAAKTNPPSNLAKILRDMKETIEKSQQPYPSTFIQNIEKAINAAQTQTIDQRGSTFNL